MKFIEQISDNRFIVEMEPQDADNTRKIVLAHDYLQFSGRDYYCTNLSGLSAPWAYGNVVNVHSKIQIPIRMAQDMLENVLNKDRKYLKKDHLVRSDGLEAYSDPVGLSYRYSTDEGTRMIAIYSQEKNQYIHIPEDLYESIKNTVKDANNNSL